MGHGRGGAISSSITRAAELAADRASAMALTIVQPWAWAIVHGPKRIENRSWRTAYRGRLLIHAGLKIWRPLIEHLRNAHRLPAPDADQLARGAIVGVCEIADCVALGEINRSMSTPFADGPWCWVLRDVRALPRPIACNGSLGLWRPDPEILAAVLEQLE